MNKYSKFIATFCIFFLNVETLSAQEFSIISAGEINLDTDEIVADEVSEYFGMYVDGVGPSKIQITVGDYTAEKEYTFQLSTTKLTSFLLANNLAEEIGIAFRRGVTGVMQVSILNEAGESQASVNISLNVKRNKGVCKKYPSKTIKQCAQLKLEKATKRDRRTFVKEFLSSIRGPIVLEP